MENLGVSYISFGSEAGNMTKLLRISREMQAHKQEINEAVRAAVKEGQAYPRARAAALRSILGRAPVLDLWTTHPLSSGLPLFLIPELRAVSGNLRQPEVKCFAYK